MDGVLEALVKEGVAKELLKNTDIKSKVSKKIKDFFKNKKFNDIVSECIVEATNKVAQNYLKKKDSIILIKSLILKVLKSRQESIMPAISKSIDFENTITNMIDEEDSLFKVIEEYIVKVFKKKLLGKASS